MSQDDKNIALSLLLHPTLRTLLIWPVKLNSSILKELKIPVSLMHKESLFLFTNLHLHKFQFKIKGTHIIFEQLY